MGALVLADKDPLEPSLKPLVNSWEDNGFERDIKQVFIDLFENYIRRQERDANVYGVPHLGSFNLVSRHVERDGLALLNNSDEPAMRYLFKAWKARNPKNGLHFLRTYLQLLWPNSWELDQQWQDKNEPYPTALSAVRYIPSAVGGDASDTHYLTCRIVAAIEFDGNPFEMIKIEPALRSSLGAEFLLELRVLVKAETNLKASNAVTTNQIVNLFGSIEFALSDYHDELGVSNSLTISQIVDLSGSAVLLIDKQSNDAYLANSVVTSQIVDLSGSALSILDNYAVKEIISNGLSVGQVVHVANGIVFPNKILSSDIEVTSALSHGQTVKLSSSFEFSSKGKSKIGLSGKSSQSKIITLKGKLKS